MYTQSKAYGMGLGVILLDDVCPGFPGDVRNASGYPFPIQYEIVSGVDIKKLVVEPNKIVCLPPLIRAAQKLEKLGCRAIVAECGYFAYFQREVAASVKIPVFMSSLLQAPMAQQLIGASRTVGILMANAKHLTDHHLESVGIKLGSNYVVGGAMDDLRCIQFDHLWTEGLRTDPPAADYALADPSSSRWRRNFTRRIPKWARWFWKPTRPSRSRPKHWQRLQKFWSPPKSGK
jgi:hypothetical protein